ncbi:DUF3494 domain-containing protein [Cryobacterium adonitolivorans]|uniref:DUF3494 domain-containing protein n=1 Tax=Cryobacterium adonitolivorans TaxID=1259189 RepID=A0A4R8W4I2_9MICO|nr:DUF3494 domain-containing protein [Cryobacterium adonitolivorans]
MRSIGGHSGPALHPPSRAYIEGETTITRHFSATRTSALTLTLLLITSLVSLGGAGQSVLAASDTRAPTTVPTIASVTPASGAMRVPTSLNASNNIVTGTSVSATFSQPLAPATIASTPAGSVSTFTLAEETGNTVSGTVALTASNTVATFTPTAPALLPNTRYTATITEAALSAAGGSLAEPVVWTFTTTPEPFTGQAPVELGVASTFAILSKTGVTNVPASVVNGNVGSSPITGAAIHLSCPEVATGIIYTVDAGGPACKTTDATLLTTTVGDMELAYADAAGRTLPNAINLGAGEIGGLTLTPGLYKWNTDLLISTDVTLTGGPNDIWIFQVAGGLDQASAKNITLAGGAQAKNVFWQVAESVSVGTTAHFEGTILGKTLIAMKTGASINGRLLAQTAVTLQSNVVTLPAQ